MERLYTMWGVLLLLFVIVFVVKNVREGKAIQPNEAGKNPLFQRGWPRTWDRSFSKRRSSGSQGRMTS